MPLTVKQLERIEQLEELDQRAKQVQMQGDELLKTIRRDNIRILFVIGIALAIGILAFVHRC